MYCTELDHSAPFGVGLYSSSIWLPVLKAPRFGHIWRERISLCYRYLPSPPIALWIFGSVRLGSTALSNVRRPSLARPNHRKYLVIPRGRKTSILKMLQRSLIPQLAARGIQFLYRNLASAHIVPQGSTQSSTGLNRNGGCSYSSCCRPGRMAYLPTPGQECP